MNRFRRDQYRLCLNLLRDGATTDVNSQDQAFKHLAVLVGEDTSDNHHCLILAANAILAKAYVEPGENGSDFDEPTSIGEVVVELVGRSVATAGDRQAREAIRKSMDAMKPKKKRKGFQLVEVLVVIAIIAMLVALLLPAVNAARKPSFPKYEAIILLKVGSIGGHPLYETEIEGNKYFVTDVHGGYVLCPKIPPRAERVD